jgi:monofunctional glycosyltransferase
MKLMSYKNFKIVFGVVFALLVLDILSAFVYPSVSHLAKENPKKSAMMEYREAQWAREGKDMKVRQKWVPLSRISPYAMKAVIISEDDKFWSHTGFDVEGMEYALEKDLKKKQFKAGGSTISQQLAKNLFLSPSRNPVRKLKEAILTWRLERALSKRRIIEIYLNIAEWGPGIFGIEEAARYHFGTSAAGLSPVQAARLASVLPNPIRFSPTNPSKFVSRRSNFIYRVLVRRGVVIPEFEEVMHPEEPAPAATEAVFGNASGVSQPAGEGSTSSGEAPGFSGVTAR